MSLVNKTAAALVLTGVAAATSSALAAGFQLTEQSSLGLGRAYAGAGIVGDDLSAVHYNAAGMTLLPGTRFQAGGVYIAMNVEYEGEEGDTENGRLKGQMIPAGYVTHQVNDQLWLGFGMTVPFGMGTEYDEGWNGKNRGTDSMVLTFDMNPNIAWKVSDYISIGAGLSAQYAKAELQMGLHGMGLGKIEADSWDWGYNFGIMFTPCETVRLGLSYRSAITHDADGTMTFSNMANVGAVKPSGPISATNPSLASLLNGVSMGSSTSLETPDTVMLTGTWEATEKLRLSGLVRWAKWSNFDTLTINNDFAGALSSFQGSALAKMEVRNEWEDTWLFSVGADYRINNAWTVRGGIAYEKDPIDDQTTRMAVIPDSDRLWLTAGASYKYSDDLQFDVAAAYLTAVGDKDLYATYGDKGAPIGEFKSIDCYMLGVQMQYRF